MSRTCDHLVKVETEETIAATNVADHELLKDGTHVAADKVLNETVKEFVENLMERCVYVCEFSKYGDICHAFLS